MNNIDKALYWMRNTRRNRYQLLQDNAYRSYKLFPEKSISLGYREDVKAFEQFLKSTLVGTSILDVGCGELGIPGYLPLGYDLYGIDPLPSAYTGRLFRRITGIAEELPFNDATFDNVIFCASLDHVFDTKKALAEAHRVLRLGGRLIIRMASPNFKERLKQRLRLIFSNRYLRIDNAVFYTPPGAYDAFHEKMYSPKKIIKLAKGFRLIKQWQYDDTEIFLSLRKE